MLSATDQQEHCLAQLEHLKQFFLSLFVSSIGLVISPTFLAQHLRVLAGGLLLTIACKTILARPAPSPSEQNHQGSQPAPARRRLLPRALELLCRRLGAAGRRADPSYAPSHKQSAHPSPCAHGCAHGHLRAARARGAAAHAAPLPATRPAARRSPGLRA